MREMKLLDRLLQQWRISKALRFIPHGSRVLDIGCSNGILLKKIGARLTQGVGIDPLLSEPSSLERIQLLRGRFPEDMPPMEPFDTIVMLAVLEHYPKEKLHDLMASCADLLKPQGRLIISVPSPRVDRIIDALRRLGLVAADTLEEHHGFDPKKTLRIFPSEVFAVATWERFQFGLNNLFVLEKR